MENIELYDFQIDFIKDLLREHQKSKHSDRDTRLLARDTLERINKQFPDTICTTSLRTGEWIEIPIES